MVRFDSKMYEIIVGNPVSSTLYPVLQQPTQTLYNAVGKALMQQYEGILSKIETHFDTNEFIAMKGQIKDLKSKKGFYGRVSMRQKPLFFAHLLLKTTQL